MSAAVAEPKGLNMSLDDLIKEQPKQHQPSNQLRRGGGGHGRGGGGGGRAAHQQAGRGGLGAEHMQNRFGEPGHAPGFQHQRPRQQQFQQGGRAGHVPAGGRMGQPNNWQQKQPMFMRLQQQPRMPFGADEPGSFGYEQPWQQPERFQQMPNPRQFEAALDDRPKQHFGMPNIIRPIPREPVWPIVREYAQPPPVRTMPEEPPEPLHDPMIPPPDYQDYQSCTFDEETGEVSVKYDELVIVKVKPSGELTLDSGGIHSPSIFQSINDVLIVVGCKLLSNTPDPNDFNWQVSDGRSLARFKDGMTLPAKGTATASRAKMILQAFQNPNPVALAATRASMAAATAAGLAAAPITNGRNHVNGHVNDHGFGKDASAVRRLQAKGRYVPY